MRKIVRIFLVLLLSGLTAFCATGREVGPPSDAVIIKGIPFFSQGQYQCGPAALAMVIDYWHRKSGNHLWVTPEEIASHIYSPSARGVLGIDLEIYGRKLGFRADRSAGAMDGLKKLVDEGIPPIIFVDYGFLSYAVHHFMVVTGYSANGVIVNSGKEEGRFISAKELDRIWKRNDYWMLAVKP